MNLLSKTDQQKIIEAFPHYPNLELMEMFNISEEDISDLRKKYKLKKQPTRMSPETIDYIKKNINIDIVTLAGVLNYSYTAIRDTKIKIIQGKLWNN